MSDYEFISKIGSTVFELTPHYHTKNNKKVIDLNRKNTHRGVIGVESAIVMISFVIVAAALAFVILNMGSTTAQKAKTSIISGLGQASSSMQVSGKILGKQCLVSGCGTFSSLSLIAIPLKISSGGESTNLDKDTTAIKIISNTISYDNIYRGTLDVSSTTGSQNFLYVADRNNYRIQKFDMSGNYVSQFGSSGSGNGQFNHPYDVVSDNTGKFFVADTDNNRVQVFDSDGNFISIIGSDVLNAPSAIAFDNNNLMYVADRGNDKIQIFDDSGNFVSSFGSSGNGNGQLNRPIGIDVNDFGNIYVVDEINHRVQVFDSDGNFISIFGTGCNGCTGDGQLDRPQSIVVASPNKIYVTNRDNHRIEVFDSDGNFVSKFGTGCDACTADGQLDTPLGVEVDTLGNIYVTSRDNRRVEIFDSDGIFVLNFGSPGSGDGQFAIPRGLGITPSYSSSAGSTVDLAFHDKLISIIQDSTFGSSVYETSSWIYFPVTNSPHNTILEKGEDAILIVAFSPSDRPSSLDEIKIDVITHDSGTLSIQRQIPIISNSIIDLG